MGTMPLCCTAVTAVTEQVMVLKAFSPDCKQWEALAVAFPDWDVWWTVLVTTSFVRISHKILPLLCGKLPLCVSLGFFPLFLELKLVYDYPMFLLCQECYSFSWLIWWANLSIKLQSGLKYFGKICPSFSELEYDSSFNISVDKSWNRHST